MINNSFWQVYVHVFLITYLRRKLCSYSVVIVMLFDPLQTVNLFQTFAFLYK